MYSRLVAPKFQQIDCLLVFYINSTHCRLTGESMRGGFYCQLHTICKEGKNQPTIVLIHLNVKIQKSYKISLLVSTDITRVSVSFSKANTRTIAKTFKDTCLYMMQRKTTATRWQLFFLYCTGRQRTRHCSI